MKSGNSIEQSRWFKSLTKAGAVGMFAIITACGGVSERTTEAEARADEQPVIEAEYFANGTRILHFSSTRLANGGTRRLIDVVQGCDGFDLVEETTVYLANSGATGGDFQRSPGHPACTDGVLTEPDFMP